MVDIHPVLARVTAAIIDRSNSQRAIYLSNIQSRRPDGYVRHKLSPSNQAHASAGCTLMDKAQLLG